MAGDEILTVAEVATELRCSRAHVYNAIAGKVVGVQRLPAISMGRRKLVRRSSLELWKRENETCILSASSEIDAVGA
jgi:excisionase family DNA binding protein